MSKRLLLIVLWAASAAAAAPPVLPADALRAAADHFHRIFPEDVVNAIPDAQAAAWLTASVPRFDCPDAAVTQTWNYRWWAFRKHIKQTPQGYIVDEFLRPVKHATDHNAISCALGLHLADGRWLRDRRYMDDYLRFWLRGGEDGRLQSKYHQYSNWTAAAVVDRWLADGNDAQLVALLDPLVDDYRQWEAERALPSGLFWQYDVRDGMEESVSGGRRERNLRPTINSYMFGNAQALALIAERAHRPELATEFAAKAAQLRQLVQEQLWNPADRFFETRRASGELAGVREIIGYTPWLFSLPEPGRGYEEAWRQLTDPQGFDAPYGPTTAERRHPGFRLAVEGDNCQWNGPSWPFSTSLTLKALARLVHEQPSLSSLSAAFFHTFQEYTRSQTIKQPDGTVTPWIDENLNPLTGEWWARALAIRKGQFRARGDHYNHSAYADVVITGIAGLRPRSDDVVEVQPLVPPGQWDWFCLDNLAYHGKTLTIVWDRTGRRYHRGAGLRVWSDGQLIASAPELTRVTGRLRSAAASAKREAQHGANN